MREPPKRKRSSSSSGSLDRTTQLSFRMPEALKVGPCLLFLSGVSAGMVLPLDVEMGAVRIGRDNTCEVFIESPEVSRVHACITRTEEGVLQIEDMGSSNGTFLNNESINRALLQEGDKLQVGPHILLKLLFHDEEELGYANQFFERSNQDSLTGLANRRYFLQHLEREVAFAKRHSRALSLAMLDIDHFKAVNDTHGHNAGDEVLCQLAARGKATIRAEDLLARYGGEEFAVVLRDTGPHGAMVMAERLRRAISTEHFVFGSIELPVTASIGIVAIGGEAWDDVTLERMIEVADARLYGAKRAGRNRVEAKSPPLVAS